MFHFMEIIMRKARIAKPEHVKGTLEEVRQRRNAVQAALEVAEAERRDNAAAFSVGDDSATEKIGRAKATIAQLTSALQDYDIAIGQMEQAAAEAEAMAAAERRAKAVEQLKGEHAQRALEIEAAEAAGRAFVAALNRAHESGERIRKQRTALLGPDDDRRDAAGRRMARRTELQHNEFVERVTRFVGGLGIFLFLEPNALSSLAEHRVPSLVEAEAAAQKLYEVTE